MKKFFFLGILVISISCKKSNYYHSQNEEISLSQWLSEEKLHSKIINSDNKCDFLNEFHKEIRIKEFKNSLYHHFGKCFLLKEQDSLEYYLLKSAQSGFHPRRLLQKYSGEVPARVEKEIFKVSQEYWASLDTTYFVAVEKAVIADQSSRDIAMQNPSTENLRKMKITDSLNLNLLDSYIKNTGHFPKTYPPSYFENFRVQIKPTVIAGHAPDSTKLRYINLCIEDAKKGLISWRTPIFISKLLLSSGISYKEKSFPFWLTEFENNEIVSDSRTYLEMLSIYDIFLKNSNKTLIIRPSKFTPDYSLDILLELKKYIIEHFNVSDERIVVEDAFLPEEIDYQSIKPYNYIFSIK